MKFKMIHKNYNVLDLDRSLAFYEKALGLRELRRKEAEDCLLYTSLLPFLSGAGGTKPGGEHRLLLHFHGRVPLPK